MHDNPALSTAARAGAVIPIFILDDVSAGEMARGAASRVWLHHSLAALDASLGGSLQYFAGDARDLLPRLVAEHGVEEIHWNRCYEPWRRERDVVIKSRLKELGADAYSHNGALLWEPWEVLKTDGTPYQVFTPFYRRARAQAPVPRKPVPAPRDCVFHGKDFGGCSLADLALLPPVRWDHAHHESVKVK